MLGTMGNFLNGIQQLKRTGVPTIISDCKRYRLEWDEITESVLRRRRVWTMTTMVAGIPLVEGANHMHRRWVVKLDEARCLEGPEIMMPIENFNPIRIVLVGDPAGLARHLLPTKASGHTKSFNCTDTRCGYVQVLLDQSCHAYSEAGTYR